MNPAPSPDAAYALDDHLLRERDVYARAKYRILLGWVGARVRAGGTVLNVGCGSGVLNGLVATAAGPAVQVLACDPDPRAVRLARASAPAGCAVACAGIADLGELGWRGDVVLACDVLEHVADDRAAMRALAAATRPRGRLLLSVPALPQLYGFHDERLGHFRRYTRASLRAVAEGSFRVRRMRYFGASLVGVALWYSRLRRAPYPIADHGGSRGARTLVRRARDGALVATLALEAAVPIGVGTTLLAELETT
jgi:SAM-dependent methyltransferase